MLDIVLVNRFVSTRRRLESLVDARNSTNEAFYDIRGTYEAARNSSLSKSVKDSLEKSYDLASKNCISETIYYNSEISKCEKEIFELVSKYDFLYQIPKSVVNVSAENFLDKGVSSDMMSYYPITLCGEECDHTIYVTDSIKKSEYNDEDIKSESMSNRYSDAIIVNDEGKILMVKRVDGDDHLFPGMWGLPGGHIDEGETPLQAVIREVKEEINLDIEDTQPILEYIDKESNTAIHYTICQSSPSSILLIEGAELTNFKFVNKEERKELSVIPGLNEIIDEIEDSVTTDLISSFSGYDTYKSDYVDDNHDLEKAEGEAKMAKVMREYKKGKLKSSSGKKVTSRKQAIAIALSEAGLSKSYELKGKSICKSEKEPEFTEDQLKELIKEHTRLVGVLEKVSDLDDSAKKEYEIQNSELEGYKKKLKTITK